MATLRAGTAKDSANDTMTAMIEAAMEQEWDIAYPGKPLSDAGKTDRLVMFAAVAKGVLRYLYKNQQFIATTPVTAAPDAPHTHTLKFDLEDPGP
jgi:hypothetical protein